MFTGLSTNYVWLRLNLFPPSIPLFFFFFVLCFQHVNAFLCIHWLVSPKYRCLFSQVVRQCFTQWDSNACSGKCRNRRNETIIVFELASNSVVTFESRALWVLVSVHGVNGGQILHGPFSAPVGLYGFHNGWSQWESFYKTELAVLARIKSDNVNINTERRWNLNEDFCQNNTFWIEKHVRHKNTAWGLECYCMVFVAAKMHIFLFSILDQFPCVLVAKAQLC